MDLPAHIGKYELEEYLGGGMARVYRARDTVIGRTVAVKILVESGNQDSDTRERFLAEARTAGNISHDNILGIYDFGEDEQYGPFMVMEFLRGENLRQAIKNGRTGDLRRKLQIALQVARALEHTHSLKIIHRDLKPENIHITTSGQVKLMDFGIAKREGLDLTRTGYMVGTPYYMAPEQVSGGPITPQVDVYAFGVLLFELLTGTHPIVGETMERVFYAVLNEPINLDQLRECRVPEPAVQLVGQCTAKVAADRPPGFEPVCAELERAIAYPERILAEQEMPTMALPDRQAQTQLAPAPVSLPAPAAAPAPAPLFLAKGRPWLLPAAAVLVIVVAALLFLVLRPTPPAPAISTPTGEMVLVPAGPFQAGPKKGSVTLPAFYIDKTEVTNAAYLKFAGETQRALPDDFPRDKPDYPVVNVTIEDARAFARWAQKRLPTAQEWEKAARGTDGRLFPWGNEPDLSRANINTKQIHPVLDFAGGASPFHALQMVGNVWEFTEDTSEPGKVHIRGGSFNESLPENVIWDHATVDVGFKNANIGFRCALDANAPPPH